LQTIACTAAFVKRGDYGVPGWKTIVAAMRQHSGKTGGKVSPLRAQTYFVLGWTSKVKRVAIV
jgi:hypothetical protein